VCVCVCVCVCERARENQTLTTYIVFNVKFTRGPPWRSTQRTILSSQWPRRCCLSNCTCHSACHCHRDLNGRSCGCGWVLVLVSLLKLGSVLLMGLRINKHVTALEVRPRSGRSGFLSFLICVFLSLLVFVFLFSFFVIFAVSLGS
jgi:hypothetical protein